MGTPPPGWSRPPAPAARKRRLRRPHWRLLTWVVLLFNAVMLLWLVVGLAGASDAGEECRDETADLSEACRLGNDIGTALGAGLIIFLWMAGAVILGVVWLVTNSRKRPPGAP
ncbi:hypothetical protein [Streptomyces sp. cmx-4-9]|uniref:hypothetical protein n=1 Tax=Streptomyces sp. cmx-4-9 TaxID=2790941 RepID=UPI003980A087